MNSDIQRIKNAMPQVVSSVFDGQALCRLLSAHFTLGESVHCQYFARGVNDTYLVDAAGHRFFLRIYRHGLRSRDEIDFELEVLNFLRRQHFPVAAPVQSRSGDYRFDVPAPEGTRFAVLFHSAPGCAPGQTLDERHARLIGLRIAEMHTLLASFETAGPMRKLDTEELIDKPWRFLTPLLHGRPQYSAFSEICQTLRTGLTQLPTDPQTQCVLAGDVHGGNLHIAEDHEVTFFDFDQCGYGWRAFELAKFLTYAHSANLPAAVRSAFISSYQQLRPLTQTELDALPMLMQASVIWAMGFRARLPEVVPLTTWSGKYFQRRMQVLESLASSAPV